MEQSRSADGSETWVVRAGQKAKYVQSFLDDGFVSIGLLPEIDAGALAMNRDQLVEWTKRIRPTWSQHKVGSQAGQLARFISDMQPGDRVATYDRERRLFFVGRIDSDATYDPTRTDEQPFVRSVAWDGRVQRDALSIEARNSLGAIKSLFKVQGKAAVELRELAVPLDAPEEEITAPVSTPDDREDGASLDELRYEVREKAAEFIEDMIFDLEWDELQELVAGLLRAMGYRTRVSPPGPDRGVDVTASPDGLGLETPRIFVQVKHQRKATGAPDIRAFLGGRKAGDRCLFVSTGGFTREASYEADRSEIPLTLVTLTDLQELVVERYDGMDIETRSLVPLTKVYWPVVEE